MQTNKSKWLYLQVFLVSLLLLVVAVYFVLQLRPAEAVRSAGTSTTSSTIKTNTLFKSGSFQRPTAVRSAGDGTNRLFILEKQGRIRALIPEKATYRRVLFLDISDRVNSRGSEQGLLGLAFDPNYRNNGVFYVNYISRTNQTVISAFRSVTGTNGVADRLSEQILLQIPQPFANHNGGDLAFGPDGHLYIAMGDGGGAGDPWRNGQNLKSLLGKILRIEVKPAVDTKIVRAYAIPPDNPFVNQNGARPEVYAYGLRNPWRISFDRDTGELWAADVGQAQREEINIIRPGENYGWNFYEGSLCYGLRANRPCSLPNHVPPVFEYGRKEGISVTGGYVYRGKEVVSLIGKYVFSDFGSGRIWTLQKNNNGYSSQLLSLRVPSISSFGEGENAELFFVTYNGALMKFAP